MSIRSRATPATVGPARITGAPNYRISGPNKVSTALHPALLVLPYPPSGNRRIGARAVRVAGKWRALVYKSAEHQDYLASVAAAVGYVAAPWPADVSLCVTVRLYRPRRTGDIDGPLKALLDALNGRVWADDSQLVELHVTRHDDKHRPRVEVAINAAQEEL